MNRKWIYIGCGGCLGLVAIFVLLAGGFFLVAKNYVDTVGHNFEQVQSEWNQLEKEYPFQIPQDDLLDSARFENFLDVRDSSVKEMEARLTWLTQFTHPQSKQDFAFLEFVKNIVMLPRDLGEIGKIQVSYLRDKQMSHTEYAYYTKVMAAELYSWNELEQVNSLYALGKKYMDPLNGLAEFEVQAKKNNPNANIEMGPFERDEFIQDIKGFIDENHPNRDLISAHTDRILSGTDSILVDVWTVQSTGDSSSEAKVYKVGPEGVQEATGTDLEGLESLPGVETREATGETSE